MICVFICRKNSQQKKILLLYSHSNHITDKPIVPTTSPEDHAESTTTLTSTSSSRATNDKSSELSQHPMSNNDNGTAPSVDHDDGSVTDDARLEPVVSGSAALMHPMEHAARLRSTKVSIKCGFCKVF